MAEKKERKAEGKGIRQKAQRQKAKGEEIRLVEDLAGEKNIKFWELAGLMRAAGWAPGKQVSEGEFDLALDRFRKRPQGGGKI